MENAYIKELIMTLEHTEICHGNMDSAWHNWHSGFLAIVAGECGFGVIMAGTVILLVLSTL